MAESIAPIVRDGGGGWHGYGKATQIAKLTQKFLRDGDPRRHLEVFDQVYEALGKRNEITKTNAFSLALDGDAGNWYRTLRVEEHLNFTALRRLFVK